MKKITGLLKLIRVDKYFKLNVFVLSTFKELVMMCSKDCMHSLYRSKRSNELIFSLIYKRILLIRQGYCYFIVHNFCCCHAMQLTGVSLSHKYVQCGPSMTSWVDTLLLSRSVPLDLSQSIPFYWGYEWTQ